MNILNEILADIDLLKSTPGALDLQTGLEVQQRLAANSMTLATMVADAAEERNNAEYMYKTSLNSYMVNYPDKLSEKKLEALAKEEYKMFYRDLVDKENILQRLTLILRQTNINIETLRQTNSQLKVEYRREVSSG